MLEIKLNKDRFKFSSAHFTIFDENSAERLHGHNYYVSCSLFFTQDLKNGIVAPFADLKTDLENTCASLDERVLIPMRSKFLEISETNHEIEVKFGRKRYVFPSEDVKMLDMENLTSECLAIYIGKELVQLWKYLKPNELRVRISETTGQSVEWVYDGF